MRNAIGLTWMICGIGLLSGCSNITGEWKSIAVEPADAISAFTMGDAKFNHDGTYEATMKYNGRERMDKGTYKYSWNTLKLKSESGSERSYKARMNLSGKTLHLKHKPAEGKAIDVELEKTGCPADCTKACCAKASACPPGCTKACCKKA